MSSSWRDQNGDKRRIDETLDIAITMKSRLIHHGVQPGPKDSTKDTLLGLRVGKLHRHLHTNMAASLITMFF